MLSSTIALSRQRCLCLFSFTSSDWPCADANCSQTSYCKLPSHVVHESSCPHSFCNLTGPPPKFLQVQLARPPFCSGEERLKGLFKCDCSGRAALRDPGWEHRVTEQQAQLMRGSKQIENKRVENETDERTVSRVRSDWLLDCHPPACAARGAAAGMKAHVPAEQCGCESQLTH